MNPGLLRHCLRWAVALVCIACSLACHARDKTDVIIMSNGDRITGEIVQLEYGILQVNTDAMGTINVEWPSVRTVQSRYDFYIELIGGRYHYGGIDTSQEGTLVILDEGATQERVKMLDVTRLSQVESTFWQRINGTLSVGYNFTKSNDISVSSLNFNATYRSERQESQLTASTLSTKSPESGTSDRDQISYTIRFPRPNRNFWMLLSALERNEELGIEGRIQAGAAIGRHLLQRSYTEVTAMAGLTFNQEWITGEEGGQQSLEGVLGLGWRIFRFNDPETTLTSSVLLYPSITESGRYRSETNITLSRELIDDLTFDLSFYNSSDSDPPDENAAKSDYGIVTSLGYKF
jgi:hypothetical protein